MTNMKIIIILLVCLVNQIKGYSSGAPTSACDSMRPGHSGNPQTSKSPISFEIEPDMYYNTNEPVTGKSYNFNFNPIITLTLSL